MFGVVKLERWGYQKVKNILW